MLENNTEDAYTILTVDDSAFNLEMLVKCLKGMAQVIPVRGGKPALKYLEKHTPDMILLDLEMPGMNGFEVLELLKKDSRLRRIPVIFLTAAEGADKEVRGIKQGAIDYIKKPIIAELVRARIALHARLKTYQNKLEDLVRVRTRQLQLTQDITIESLAKLADSRDPETGGHIKRTQGYVMALVKAMQNQGLHKDIIDEKYILDIGKSSPLHDIGKVGIPDAILLKNGRLTDEEYEIMKTHTILGADALNEALAKLDKDSFLSTGRELIVSHHEKWNGSGYPGGLKGNEIPLAGRIMALADVYDALISKRIYKEAFSHREAAEIIKKSKGAHFDPEIVDVFLSVETEFIDIAQNYSAETDCL